jgi:5-formyltetrahydrofolate cyclo-ligase
MRQQKQKLRVQSRLSRESLAVAEINRWSRLIQRQALEFPAYRDASAVALYSPIENEVATDAIRDHTLGAHKKLFYPKIGKDGRPGLIRVASVEELRPGAIGILEPTGSEGLAREDRASLAVFVPGLAFDLCGNRLGRGRGWYDRMLGSLTGGATVVGLAYEIQIVDALPVERWDQKMRWIITESRVIECGQSIALSGRPC